MNATQFIRLIGVFLLLPIILPAAEQKQRTTAKDGSRLDSPTGKPQATLININNVSAWYWADGIQENRPDLPANAGLTFPRGTVHAVYAAGIFWGGKVKDGIAPALRANGTYYGYTGWQPGRILGLRTGLAEDTSAADARIWRIRKDYGTADLRDDAAEYFLVPQDSVTQAQIDSLRNQYARDWSEWPWQKGAPFYDANHDGIKGLGEDPGLAGADQVIWYVANDLVSLQPWLCPPTGIEMQGTIWGYNSSDAIGNTIFKRCRLVYKGTASTPANAVIDSMCFGQWSDPDIGDLYDDFAGCDTTLNLGFAYNGTAVDAEYARFGLAPPAFGYTVLQGPLFPGGSLFDTAMFDFRKIPGKKNRHMTGFTAQAIGGSIEYEPYLNYTGAIQWYQGFRGLPFSPPGPPDPPPLTDFTTSKETFFWLSGNPVAQTGWIDGIIDLPGERRILLGSGPFTMALGDTQEIIVADVGGLGTTNINSITVLKSSIIAARDFFASLANPVAVNIDGGPDGARPDHCTLLQNYPNPFNPSTQIQYGLSQSSRVRLTIYNTLGAEIVRLVDETQQPGYHSVEWDGRTASGVPVASGVYIYKLEAGAFVGARKMLIVK